MLDSRFFLCHLQGVSTNVLDRVLPSYEYNILSVQKLDFNEDIEEPPMPNSSYQLRISLTLEDALLLKQADLDVELCEVNILREVDNHVFRLSECAWTAATGIMLVKQTNSREYPLVCTDFFRNWCRSVDLSEEFVTYISNYLASVRMMSKVLEEDVIILRNPELYTI
jgi:hypothetical protein